MTTSHAGDAVVTKLVTFGRILREAGVEVGPGRLQNALLALDQIDLRQRTEVYGALACTMVARRDDLEIFDRAFRAWFEQAPTRNLGQRPPDLGLGIDEKKKPEVLAGHGLEQTPPGEEDDDEPVTEDAVSAWSPVEILRQRDFASMTRDELLRVRQAMELLARSLPKRPSRRLEASADGRHIDPRRTLRQAMRHEGEPVERSFRRPKQVERRLRLPVRRLRLHGALRPRAGAVPAGGGRDGPARRGLHLRHPPHAPHAVPRRPRPRAGAGARRAGRAGLGGRNAHRRGAARVQRPLRAPRHDARRHRHHRVGRLGARRRRRCCASRWPACGAAPGRSSGSTP